MTLLPRATAWLLPLVYCTQSMAADATVVNASGNLLQVTVSLVLVLGLIIAISIGFKKFGINRMQSNLPVKVIGAISVGNNQRIMVLEAGDEWLVLGITPQNITTLTALPRQENPVSADPANNQPNFSAWMQATLEKYHAKKP